MTPLGTDERAERHVNVFLLQPHLSDVVVAVADANPSMFQSHPSHVTYVTGSTIRLVG